MNRPVSVDLLAAPSVQPTFLPVEPDMLKVCEALGFDPTNHHNAAKCPYCRPRLPVVSDERKLREALQKIIAATHSHVDGRDLLAQLHPRRSLDIKRRVDARETWFEGDWLSDLWREIKAARTALSEGAQEASLNQPAPLVKDGGREDGK